MALNFDGKWSDRESPPRPRMDFTRGLLLRDLQRADELTGMRAVAARTTLLLLTVSCVAGTIYYDSDDADFCVCKGSAWFFIDGTATTSGECGTP